MSGMQAGKSGQGNSLIVQNFHVASLEDIFLNVLHTAIAAEGLFHLRHGQWRSEKAFAAVSGDDYRHSADAVLTEMRDEEDVYLMVRRGGCIVGDGPRTVLIAVSP